MRQAEPGCTFDANLNDFDDEVRIRTSSASNGFAPDSSWPRTLPLDSVKDSAPDPDPVI